MTRSILITGCSSGIGYDAAHALKARGWRVFASCRKSDDCDRLRAEGFESPQLDHSDTASMTAALAEVLQVTGGTLDALFNNGAYGVPGAVEDLPTDALRANFEANFFGYHELTRQVIPVMRKQGHGRIVMCSSVLGFSVLPWRAAYNASKYALEGYTDTLRIEMRDTDIKVILIEPGPIGTKIRENSRPHFEKWIDWKASARRAQYEGYLIKRLYEDKDKPDPFELTPDAVSKKLIHAVEAPNPKPRYFVTTPTYMISWINRLFPTRARDWLFSKGG